MELTRNTIIELDQIRMRCDPASGKLHFTYDSFSNLPTWPKGPLLEIIDGDLFVVPPPIPVHQQIVANLLAAIKPYTDGTGIGIVIPAPVDVILSDDNVVIPDLLFISTAREDIVKDNNIQGAPDLIVEITSSKPARDEITKKQLYEGFGILEYWIINPEAKRVKVFSRRPGEKQFSSIVEFITGDTILVNCIPGLHISVDAIFKIIK
ncbi:MAG: Uma2 family endonuclease [Candidatus Sigynarchaeota archaeon]